MVADKESFKEMGAPAKYSTVPGTYNDKNGQRVADVIIFHDGQAYQIKLNYIYNAGDRIRGYQSLQKSDWSGWTLYSRPYASGDFSKVIISNPSLPYYYKPDYWNAVDESLDPFKIVRYAEPVDHPKTNHDIVLGNPWNPQYWNGGSIYQDAYADESGNIIQSGKTYSLSFWAKGSKGGGTNYPKATVQWYVGASPSGPLWTKTIDSTNWQSYSLPTPSPLPSSNPNDKIFARISFIAEPGGYAYISTTNFGIPGGTT